jgi:hypothetical protein
MRQAVPAQFAANKSLAPLPAPLRGWIENDNLAASGGIGCSVLENWFPTPASLRVRGGALLKTTVGAPVDTLLAYRTGVTEKLFACAEGDIYDISLFPTTVGFPVWTGTTARRSSTQMVTAAGEYLVSVNGADLAIYYDGTRWNPLTSVAVNQLVYDGLTEAFVVGRTVTGGSSGATGVIAGVVPFTATTGALKLTGGSGTFTDNDALTTSGTAGGAATANGGSSSISAITITGVSTASLIHVWQHNSRLWFVQGGAVSGGTTKAWYLPIDSIGGAAVSFDLGGLFAKGGSLLFGATWSSDSGSGFADRNVFVSDQGEIVVFAGDDPASNYEIAGHYQIARPVSPQTWQAGGDLIIATEDGMVAMSAVATVDRAALIARAITANIEPSWRRMVSTNLTGLPAQIMKWNSMGLVGWPHRAGTDLFVVNLITGSWAKWTGWDVQSMAMHQGLAYFGDTTSVYQMEAAGSDNGASYICRLSWLPEHLGAPGTFKVVGLIRAIFRSLVPFNPKLSVAENYGKSFPSAPNAPIETTIEALWDVGIWDSSIWDDAPDSEERGTAITQWVAAGACGYAVSPQVQITAGGSRMLDAELVALDLSYSVGANVC